MFYKEEGVKIKTDFVNEFNLNHSNQLASCVIYPFVEDRIFLSHGAKIQMSLNVTRTNGQEDRLKILPWGGTGRDFERMAHPLKRQN